MMRFLAVLACAGLLLAQRPPVEDAWDLLAKGHRTEAIRLLHEIVKTHPRDADARLLLGSVLMEDGKREESIAQLTEAVRLRPKSAEAQNALGEAFNSFDNPKAARGPFEKAVELNPKLAQARVNLGLVLLEAGAFDEAARHLDRGIELLGETAEAAYPHYLRAKVYTEQSEAEKAAAQLKQAVALRPDFAEAWSDLGEARKSLSDDGGALAAFERAVAISPEDAVAQTRLGLEYLNQGRAHAAVEHLQIAVRHDPENQTALNDLQRALRADGCTEQADQVKKKLAELLRAKDKSDQNSLIAIQLNSQGAELEKGGNLSAALEKYRAALDLYPEHVGIRTNFAVALLRLGHWRDGLAQLREALRRDPDSVTLKTALDDALAQAPVEFGGKGKSVTSPNTGAKH